MSIIRTGASRFVSYRIDQIADPRLTADELLGLAIDLTRAGDYAAARCGLEIAGAFYAAGAIADMLARGLDAEQPAALEPGRAPGPVLV